MRQVTGRVLHGLRFAKFRLATVSLILAALSVGTPSLRAAERTLDIYWIDSEGGGSTLIVTPAGESVPIDCGHPASRD